MKSELYAIQLRKEMKEQVEQYITQISLKHIILDLSSINFIDSMGINAMIQVKNFFNLVWYQIDSNWPFVLAKRHVQGIRNHFTFGLCETYVLFRFFFCNFITKLLIYLIYVRMYIQSVQKVLVWREVWLFEHLSDNSRRSDKHFAQETNDCAKLESTRIFHEHKCCRKSRESHQWLWPSLQTQRPNKTQHIRWDNH